MSFLTLFVCTTLVTADADAKTDTKPEPRRFHEISRDLTDLLKQEARAANQAERTLAICRMTVLYRELVTDPRLSSSDTLKEYKTQLWHRLTKIKADIKRDLARGGGKKPAADVASAPPATVPAESSSTSRSPVATESASAAGAAGGQPQADWGQDLVDLIEATINPQFWDSNGGPGTIVYYQPLKALVVRATGEVHRDLGGLMRALGR